MKVAGPSTDISDLQSRLDELKGKPIFQAYHTFGTMFLFDLGEKTEKLSRGKINLNGENTVIVENSTWTIKKDDEVVIDSGNDVQEMRRKIPVLVDKKIEAIETKDNTINIIFSDNLSLSVVLSEEENRDLGIRLSSGNWIDIGPGLSWVEVTGDHIE